MIVRKEIGNSEKGINKSYRIPAVFQDVVFVFLLSGPVNSRRPRNDTAWSFQIRFTQEESGTQVVHLKGPAERLSHSANGLLFQSILPLKIAHPSQSTRHVHLLPGDLQ